MKRVVVLLAFASAALSLGAAAATSPLVLPRPAPQLRRYTKDARELATLNASCEFCHREIAAEWRQSNHAQAYTNGPFQRALGREWPGARPFCQGCHAPEAPTTTPPAAQVGAMGVGCISCHVPLGPVLAAHPVERRRAPHATLGSDAFATSAACAACHEFRFPHREGMEKGDFMQRTLSEHVDMAASKTACAACHMPRVGEGEGAHRSHRFRGGYDEAFVRAALRVAALRKGPRSVRITLTPVGVTHAVPTGDLFRRLAILVEGVDAKGARVGQKARFLSRHFRREPGKGFFEVDDDRPQGGPRIIDFDLDPAVSGLSIAYRVVYQRVAHQSSEDEAQAVVESELELASGVLEPPG